MPEETFETLSLLARYWFTLLGVMIVLRTFRWLLKEHREKQRRLRSLPDAGMVGEFLVLQGGEHLEVNSVLPVSWEGTLGSIRSNDIPVPVPGVRRHHLDFHFEEGQGLIAEPRWRRVFGVDGREVSTPAQGRSLPMKNGSLLQVGEATLQLRIFVGLEVEGEPLPMPEQASEQLPEQTSGQLPEEPLWQEEEPEQLPEEPQWQEEQAPGLPAGLPEEEIPQETETEPPRRRRRRTEG